MQINVKDETYRSIFKNMDNVRVMLKSECRGCNRDLSVPVAYITSQDFQAKERVKEYRNEICLDCSTRSNKKKDNFMEVKESILNGLTETEYQNRYGRAWNE